MKDILIIGGGAVGAFVARKASSYNLKVSVIEACQDVGDVTSMANSAIVHSGYDPVPGTKKAIFNVKGNRMFPQVCKDLDVHFEPIGSLTVALNDAQYQMLLPLLERAKENGVPAELLSAEQVKAMEPNISPKVKGALLCPTAGTVNPFTLVAHAMENAVDNGVKVHLGEKVIGIEEKDGIFVVHTTRRDHEAKVVINCAGLHSDEIAAMVEPIDWSIKPRKGEYFVLDHYAKGLVNHVLFPLPSEKGKGILVTSTTSGNYLVGPSSEWDDDKEDFSTDAPTLANVKEQALMMVPNIPFREQIRTFSGLRATPSTHDFIIEPSKKYPNFINCGGIESPGLVSSPAIGEYVIDELVSKVLPLEPKESYNPKIRPYLHPATMDEQELNALIRKDPDYGIVVCNCEKVTLGEIKDCLSRSLPPQTVKAVKKRTRAGFGKCQGGFCQPKVVMLLAKHFGCSPADILYDNQGSEIIAKEAK
ncbi:MAG: FAD-dependent oxidoreductase [Bacilli bacterium]|nr:FAD-dependent oxidoreductase [Bacilli bacterium]